jgi:hypothetical protein
MTQRIDHGAARPIRRAARLAAATSIIVLWCGGAADAADSDPRAAIVPCGSGSRLPATVYAPAELLRYVDAMLSSSHTFRTQCRRIADAPWLRVLIQVDPALAEWRYRARTTIDRVATGEMLARVRISPRHNPIEWIAHEFEHIVEQLDGVSLPSLQAANKGVWFSMEQMYETARAIGAGRAVVAETPRSMRERRRSDNFVE